MSDISDIESSSVWGCGLKLQGIEQKQRGSEVILRVRMWIEIKITWNMPMGTLCHPPREGVDWNFFTAAAGCLINASPSTWGCGLKYFCGVPTLKIYVTLCVRCGLKSANCSSNIRFWRVALRAKTVPVFFVCTMTVACIFYNVPLYTYYVYKGIYTIGSGKYFLYKYKKSLW